MSLFYQRVTRSQEETRKNLQDRRGARNGAATKNGLVEEATERRAADPVLVTLVGHAVDGVGVARRGFHGRNLGLKVEGETVNPGRAVGIVVVHAPILS